LFLSSLSTYLFYLFNALHNHFEQKVGHRNDWSLILQIFEPLKSGFHIDFILSKNVVDLPFKRCFKLSQRFMILKCQLNVFYLFILFSNSEYIW
jgi:hypothetical protein